MNPCLKMEEKCKKSVNKEFKITRKSNLLHQIMGEQTMKLKCDKPLFMTCYLIFVKKLREKEKSNLFFFSSNKQNGQSKV